MTSILRLAILMVFSAAAVAQTIPGVDAIVVRSDARTFPNGYVAPARTFTITRPLTGTYVPGVVLVKTRTSYGVHQHARTIDGSSANIMLSTAGMKSVTSAYGAEKAMLSADARRYEQVAGLDRLYRVEYSEPIDPFDLCKKLMESPDVEYAVPMTIHKPFFTPNDPRYAQQPWMPLMKMESAWDVSKGSDQTLIAIVDSGTDWQHEDLATKIWMNPGEIANNGKDDDGNGYVDDIRGWDFVGNITVQQAQQGITIPDNDPKVTYPTINGTNGHGTVVAGCAAAATNNAIGVAGTGFNCKILAIKCGADNPAIGSIIQGYTAIRYATDLGADVINCSWGGPGSDPSAQDIIDYANSKGAVVVAASGNDGQNLDTYSQNPANLDGVLTVGATNNSDRVANFSNYGWGVHVYAPGENILSTFPNNNYQALSGTSFSSPLVAGIVGLLKTIHPTWTPEQIREHIRSTSDALPNVSAGNRPLYFGRVNADRALRSNTSWTGADRIPGITLTSTTVAGSGTITSYAPTTVTLELTNLLGDASGVILQVRSRDNSVSISPAGDIQIGTMANAAKKQQQLTITLAPNYPWYATELELELTIKAGSYLNYALAKVPVRLPSLNSHSVLVPSLGATVTNVDYADDGTLWAASTYYTSPIFIKGTATGGGGIIPSPFNPVCLSAYSTSACMIGGIRNSTPTIGYTTNGSSFSTTGVNAVLASVADIKMYDANSAIAIGNPVSNRIGVARTTNGGSIWSAVSNAPLTANANERVINGSACFLGDALWFGTTEERILYSTNRGQTWGGGKLNVNNAVIVSISFRDNNNGVMLYRTSAASNAPYRIASSSNGGATWVADVFDPSTLGITATKVASSGGNHHLLIGSLGEVFGSDNNGDAWQPVLSKPAGAVVNAKAIKSSFTAVLLCGDQTSLLQYAYSGPNGSKILEVVDGAIDYGSVESGKNRLRSVQVKSTGESAVQIDSVTLTMNGTTPDSAFRITSPLDQIIAPGSTDQLGIRLYATDEGNYSATVKIYSNASTPVQTATLTAVVTPVVSVNEETGVANVIVAPNPASYQVKIMLDDRGTISLIDLNGRIVGSWQAAEAGAFPLDLSAFSVGTYTLVLTQGEHISRHTLSIIR